LASLYDHPGDVFGLETELLHGEEIKVLEEIDGGARVESLTDGYTGYIRKGTYGDDGESTHLISNLGSFLYSDPDLKSPTITRLSFLSRITVLAERGDYAQTPHGWLHRATLSPLGAIANDPVEIARRFLGIPYKWGGRTTLGMDCSALVQLAFAACGVALPRNSGDQAKVLADKPGPMAAGDVVCVPGHIGIATGPTTMIHASGHAMCVVEEPIEKMAQDRGFGLGDVKVKSPVILNAVKDPFRPLSPSA
jgi:hypothetical protein